MPTTRRPRKGSLQFWPRKRHKGNVRVRSLDFGFAAYKVGMTHCIVTDNRPTATTKKLPISIPVTILECPPMKAFGIRYYKKDAYGLHATTQLLADNLDKSLQRKVSLPKKKTTKELGSFDEVRILVHTQPRLTGIGQKRPQIFEMKVDEAKAKELLNKEINVADVIKPGAQLDIHAVTKGKGFQGEVKRYGVSLRNHKSEKRIRGKAQLGAWTPSKVSYTVPQPGKMGHHLRTEYNKWVIDVNDDPKKIQQKGGFVHYGLVKNPYVLLKGSIAGPKKALVKLMPATRPANLPNKAPVISQISVEAKQ